MTEMSVTVPRYQTTRILFISAEWISDTELGMIASQIFVYMTRLYE